MAIDRAQPDKPVDLGELLAELANKIERVKQLYEQYFMGIEKMEPMVARKEVQRAMLTLQQQYIRNTGLRFRFQTMLQKWGLYTTYWNRTLREIENGTYVRHLQKARRAAERAGKEMPKELLPPPQRSGSDPSLPKIHDADTMPGRGPLPTVPTDPNLERVPAAAPKPPPPPAAAFKTTRPPPPKRAPPPPFPAPPAAAPLPAIPGMTERELRALHIKFREARKQSGEHDAVSYEALVHSLAKQVPRVLGQGASGVKFHVAVQDGKAIVKATPTK